jgi:hypothetical protein
MSNAGGITILNFKLYYRAITTATTTKNSMVLAQKQTGRTMDQNRRSRH